MNFLVEKYCKIQLGLSLLPELQRNSILAGIWRVSRHRRVFAKLELSVFTFEHVPDFVNNGDRSQYSMGLCRTI